MTLVQATAVDHCNIKVNKHFTSDIPAVLRQLQVIETQRCENLAHSSLQFATMQQKLYQQALDTNWKDLVLVNTFNPLQDINVFVAFTSTGAKCPPLRCLVLIAFCRHLLPPLRSSQLPPRSQTLNARNTMRSLNLALLRRLQTPLSQLSVRRRGHRRLFLPRRLLWMGK